ncbi:hypothetical protein LC087_06080 [Bacillus carboniphilus]|uniref:YpoC-like domain-containing protein n=1 Tax=Bacillus carboniphilus TaxID=86663 RepID=A0ABY9JWE3_9BACI|nr:hypothetical protein [Bacillus carboniphilus]WLR43704.1 hypothetical protein LC087_06080 [Bacillus carboniphilus]
MNMCLKGEEVFSSYLVLKKETYPTNEETLNNQPLYFDLLLHTRQEVLFKPWFEIEQSLTWLFQNWEEGFKQHVNQKKKGKVSEEFMIKGLVSFFAFLYWMNQKPVASLHVVDINDLTMKPVNVVERLSFVMNKPTQHHSVIQLDQLYREAMKQAQKKIAIDKMKKNI